MRMCVLVIFAMKIVNLKVYAINEKQLGLHSPCVIVHVNSHKHTDADILDIPQHLESICGTEDDFEHHGFEIIESMLHRKFNLSKDATQRYKKVIETLWLKEVEMRQGMCKCM